VHPKVLGADGWVVARKLSRAGITDDFVLAGGTGLSLQLGHRVSDDLDFFRAGAFESARLTESLAALGQLGIRDRSAGTLHATLDGLRVSFLEAQAPFLYPGTPYRGLTVADARDIAAMKLVAIGGRGRRKDFVDLYFYLRSGGSLRALFELLRRGFRGVDYNEYHLVKSLTFFDDADAEPMPRMLQKAEWLEIKRAIVEEASRIR
jgi:hypothetical protein